VQTKTRKRWTETFPSELRQLVKTLRLRDFHSMCDAISPTHVLSASLLITIGFPQSLSTKDASLSEKPTKPPVAKIIVWPVRTDCNTHIPDVAVADGMQLSVCEFSLQN